MLEVSLIYVVLLTLTLDTLQLKILKIFKRNYFENYLQPFSHLLRPVHTKPEVFGNAALFLRLR